MLISTLLLTNINLTATDIEHEKENTSEFISNPRGNGEIIWEDLEVISEPVQFQDFNIGNSNEPVIAVENHNVYVVWKDINNTHGSGGAETDIFYMHYNGNSWSEIQVISEPIFGTNTNQGSSQAPDIVVEDEKIYVVWRDNSPLNGSGSDYDI